MIVSYSSLQSRCTFTSVVYVGTHFRTGFERGIYQNKTRGPFVPPTPTVQFVERTRNHYHYVAKNQDGEVIGAKRSIMVPRFAVVTDSKVINWCGTSVLAQKALARHEKFVADRVKHNPWMAQGVYIVRVFEVDRKEFLRIKKEL